MKTLYMLRHAKSSWKHRVDDHKRPLKGRGKRDAILLSEYVKNNVPPPERIISSDANRAHSTARYFKDAWDISENIFITNHDLYDFGGQKVLDVIKSIDDSYTSAMIVGHNHAFTSIANMLGSIRIDSIPTCGFVIIEFDENSWKNLSYGKTTMTLFPRDLK